MVHGDRYADTQPGLWGPPVLTGNVPTPETFLLPAAKVLLDSR